MSRWAGADAGETQIFLLLARALDLIDTLTAGITSLPGIGPLLGAEFVAATNGGMAFFATPDRLAGFADPASGPRGSGRSRGNPHRPKRYHRGLQRVFCTPALISIRSCAESRRFYDRKGAEG